MHSQTFETGEDGTLYSIVRTPAEEEARKAEFYVKMLNAMIAICSVGETQEAISRAGMVLEEMKIPLRPPVYPMPVLVPPAARRQP